MSRLRAEAKSGRSSQSGFDKPAAINSIHGLESLQEEGMAANGHRDKPIAGGVDRRIRAARSSPAF